MWINLHHYESGDDIIVQTQHITQISKDQRKEYRDRTVVAFCCDDYLHVRESIEEINRILLGLEAC